jgi:hypothetical protein
MTRSIFLYGLWCCGVVLLFLTSAFWGYSPFADGGRATRAGFYAGGPNHK